MPKIASNFELGSAQPIDSRLVVENESDLSSLIAYEGLEVYIKSLKLKKIYEGYTWKDVSLTKENVGLGNVDNTSDVNKPVSTATQNALNLKADAVNVYTKTETNTELNKKVDKVEGKQLSTNDLTDELLAKLNELKNYDDTKLLAKIESIETILKSDNLDLDTLQEIVNSLTSTNTSLESVKSTLNELSTKLDTISDYVLNIDYDTLIAFDTSEIVIGSSATTAILGKVILGQMILG